MVDPETVSLLSLLPEGVSVVAVLVVVVLFLKYMAAERRASADERAEARKSFEQGLDRVLEAHAMSSRQISERLESIEQRLEAHRP
ncbi:MAG: hypothetical protein GY711_18970 [bacterium]|nr:hypothetical protein [bacterium]